MIGVAWTDPAPQPFQQDMRICELAPDPAPQPAQLLLPGGPWVLQELLRTLRFELEEGAGKAALEFDDSDVGRFGLQAVQEVSAALLRAEMLACQWGCIMRRQIDFATENG